MPVYFEDAELNDTELVKRCLQRIGKLKLKFSNKQHYK